jgi:hypothetical protein
MAYGVQNYGVCFTARAFYTSFFSTTTSFGGAPLERSLAFYFLFYFLSFAACVMVLVL